MDEIAKAPAFQAQGPDYMVSLISWTSEALWRESLSDPLSGESVSATQ